MGMNVIQPVTILDGNQYLVQGPADKTGQATSFDNVYNRSCGDETLDEIFEDVSQEYGVNVNLLKAVAQAESGFDALFPLHRMMMSMPHHHAVQWE